LLVFCLKNIKKKTLRNLTAYRSSNIPFNLINQKISVYNGAWLLTKKIETAMIGLKVGEFLQLNVLMGNLKQKHEIKNA